MAGLMWLFSRNLYPIPYPVGTLVAQVSAVLLMAFFYQPLEAMGVSRGALWAVCAGGLEVMGYHAWLITCLWRIRTYAAIGSS